MKRFNVKEDIMGFLCTYTDLREFVDGVANPTYGTKISSEVTWRKFKANCPRLNQQCSQLSEAYVPAVTVCRQRLF